MEELASSSGGVRDIAPVLREFLRRLETLIAIEETALS
jgi:hypothetical protein